MGNRAKNPIPPSRGGLTVRRLGRGSDELAALDARIVERINALRAFLGKAPDWQPTPAPQPVAAEVHPVGLSGHHVAGRLAVTESGGESLADIDRRLNDRINALRAMQGKSADWQPGTGAGGAAEGTARRGYGT